MKIYYPIGFIFNCLSILLLILFSFFIIKFVSHNSLASFASDSANYMAMALYISPWQEASAAIKSVWPLQDFPPFYPFILAITGAAHNFTAAHILTASFLIFSLPLLYLFTRQCCVSKWQALTITAVFSISPSTFMNSMGILSENLYIFISLIIFNIAPKLERNDFRLSLAFGVLIALLILTRTIGVSMLIAYAMTGFLLMRNGKINSATFCLPIIVSTGINILSKVLHQSSVPSQYIKQLNDLTFEDQLIALIDAWFSSWQLYWVDTLIVPYSIVLILGIFACIGLFIRCCILKLDAIYVFIYLLILLVWPHPGQALRFIYPVQAILLVYAFFFISYLFKNYIPAYRHTPVTILILMMTVVILPPLSFLYNRYTIGETSGFNQIKEFYRFPDLNSANANAATQIQMFNDMKYIKKTTKPDDLILYFEPTYIALLADRNSKSIEFNSDNGIYSLEIPSYADYIYLSRIHPRKSKKEINGLDMQGYILEYTENVWTHYSSVSNKPTSIFLKLN